MDKLRMLVICPYPGMKEEFARIAAQRDDLDISTCVGDLESGLEQARRMTQDEPFDFIASRGGTAELIAGTLSTPVLEIPISAGDLLHAIKTAEANWDKFAIVGFPAVIVNAQTVCELMKYDVEMRTIHSQAEARNVLTALQRDGCSVVIGDRVTCVVAAGLGMESVLITSSPAALSSVVEQALKLKASLSRQRRARQILERVVEDARLYVCGFDSEGIVSYSTLPTGRGWERLIGTLRDMLPDVRNARTLQLHRKIEGRQYTVELGVAEGIEGAEVVAVLRPMLSPELTNDGTVIMEAQILENDPEAEARYATDGGLWNSVRELALNAARGVGPVVIVGEFGTEKNVVAGYVHKNGPFADNPCCIVDCLRISDRDWHRLIESPSSPLYGEQLTIYFRSVDQMSVRQANDVVQFMKHSNLSRRCKLIFTCTRDERNQAKSDINSYLLTLPECNALYLPPLRSCKNEIAQNLAVLINLYNLQHGAQIVGFDADAMDRIREYDWPGNYTQFRRVIRELLDGANGAYVSAKSVSASIVKEGPLYRPSVTQQAGDGATAASFDLDRPLCSIVTDVVNTIMGEEGMNKKKAAERLGISRSTLWRITRPMSGDTMRD